jgi:hypothetical protein
MTYSEDVLTTNHLCSTYQKDRVMSKRVIYARIIAKYWRGTFGGLSIAILTWLVIFEMVSPYTASVGAILLWSGGFIHRRIDPLGVFKKNTTEDESL